MIPLLFIKFGNLRNVAIDSPHFLISIMKFKVLSSIVWFYKVINSKQPSINYFGPVDFSTL